MNLYLLERKDEKILYDANDGFVVRAKSAKRARDLANLRVSDERHSLGDDIWLNPKKSSCRQIKKTGLEMIILRDYNAG